MWQLSNCLARVGVYIEGEVFRQPLQPAAHSDEPNPLPLAGLQLLPSIEIVIKGSNFSMK